MSELSGRMKTHCCWCSKCKACRADELAAAAELDRLQAIVDKLPKTADGVPIEYKMTVYWWEPRNPPNFPPVVASGVVHSITSIAFVDPGEQYRWCSRGSLPFNRCYSTRESAEAAREKGDA